MVPTPADAHLVGVEFGAFYAGGLHLTLALEHMAALLLIGLIAAQQSRASARWTLLALPVGLALGCIAAMIDPNLPQVIPVAASLALAGALGIAAPRVAALPLALAAGLVSLVHGYANGVSAAGSAVDLWLYTAGIVSFGTVLGTLSVAGLTAVMPLGTWTRLGSRVLCSWIATLGILMFGLQAMA